MFTKNAGGMELVTAIQQLVERSEAGSQASDQPGSLPGESSRQSLIDAIGVLVDEYATTQTRIVRTEESKSRHGVDQRD